MFQAVISRLRAVIENPSSDMAMLAGLSTGVLSAILLNHLLSLPLDGHFALFEAVLALDPLALFVGGLWLLFWAMCFQGMVISALALSRVRLT